MRKTLPRTLQSIRQTVPNPHIILITEKGIYGDLRNKGLAQCTSEFTLFIDDDVTLDQNWYEECMRLFRQNANSIAIAGPWCWVLVKTSEFKALGGFPSLGVALRKKFKDQMVYLDDKHSYCDHIYGSPLTMIQHQFHWLTHGFQTEVKIGYNKNPKESLTVMFRSLWNHDPAMAIIQPLWMIKVLFVLPFMGDGIKL